MRAFLAGRAGTGTRTDPFRPAADTGGFPWACWDINHPDTNELLGYVVVSTVLAAPVGTVDLGDPTDKVSMRTVKLGTQGAADIETLFGVSASRVRNMTGAQVIKFLNRVEPVMAAQWGETIAELIDETDV